MEGLRVSELAERGGVAPSTIRFYERAGLLSPARRAELRAFESQLQAVLDRLSAHDPGPERCGKGCSCETDLDLVPGVAVPGPGPWGCSLGRDALASRIGQWRALAAGASLLDSASPV